MAYYGPRRPAGSSVRLLSTDVPRTTAAVRQTVLDVRLTTAWMESRPEIDGKRLGILGTSLGSFMAALAAEMEPKLGRVALLLGGGGLVDGYYDDPRATAYRKMFEALGGKKAALAKLVAPYDPITRAANLKGRKLLMLEARHDEIVPPKMAERLSRASGKQEIVWYNCGHYTAAIYVADALEQVVRHFGGVKKLRATDPRHTLHPPRVEHLAVRAARRVEDQAAFRAVDHRLAARPACRVPPQDRLQSPAPSPRRSGRPTGRCTPSSPMLRRRSPRPSRRAAELDEGDLLEEPANDLDAVAALTPFAPRLQEGAVVMVVGRDLDVRPACGPRPSPRRRACAGGRSRRRCRSGTALPARRSRGSCRA